MAQQTIDIGTGPDDNTGDHLRGAFTKVNDNFDELYLATSGSGITAIVQDTDPHLGGDLVVNGQAIVSATAGDIAITPDTTGDLILDGLKWPQADGTATYVLSTDGFGQLSWTAQASAGGNWIYGNNGVDFPNPPSGGNNRGIVVGDNASIDIYSPDSIAIGTNATITGSFVSNRPYQIAIGYAASSAQNAVSVGHSANCSGYDAVAIGTAANSGGTDAIAVGKGTLSPASQQTSIGQGVTDSSVTTPGISFSAKLGNGVTGVNKNLLHLYDKGKLELYGIEAMFVAPTYTLLTLPPVVAGGMIFVSDATGGGALTGSQCFSNGTVWIDVTTGIAVA